MAPTSLSQKLPALPGFSARAGFGARGAGRAKDALQVQLGGNDRAGLGPLVRSNNAFLLERVDDPARPRVPDSETPLHGADRGLPRHHDEARRLRQELVV